MKELNQKYVLHIPNYKFKNNELLLIDIEDILNELMVNLNENGYTSFYTQKIESHYKSRHFDEIIITIFTSEKGKIEEIFGEWFLKNNSILEQEEYAYEKNNSLYIKLIKTSSRVQK